MLRVVADLGRRAVVQVSRRDAVQSVGRTNQRPILSLAAVLLLLIPTLLLSCGDNPAGPIPPRPEAPRPASIRVSPASATLPALEATVQLTVDVRDQNGQPMAGATVEWTSSADSVATVGATGLARAAGKGEATITASAGTASGTATITVRQVAGTVSVSPSADTLVAGDTVRLAAAAFDENGHAVRGAVFSWSSSDPAVATVDSLGLVTALGPDEAAISAASGLATGQMELVVLPRVPTDLDITPAMVALAALGDTVRLAAEARDQLGRVVEDAAVSWSSSDETVATVDRGGLVTAVGEGTTSVTASSGAASGAVAVLVMQIASSVIVAPSTAAIASRATIGLEAEAFDWNGRPVAEAEFSWTVSDPAVATVDGMGVVLGIGDGVATITAQAGYARGTSKIAVGNPDRGALAAFYEATDGPNWSRSDNWLSDAPLAEWHGVRVDGRARVSHVNLDKNDVGGRLPAELGHLTALVELSLRDNRLAGPIPPELGRSSELELLDLGRNQLTGSIPSTLGNLPSLRSLNLSYNWLTGLIPRELGKLDKLERLILRSNPLTGAIPRELGNLASLSVLNLIDTPLAGPIPHELGQLDNLRILWLYRNQLTGSIPPELGRLSNLRVMELRENTLTGSIPPELGKLLQLAILNLDNNQLTGPIPPEFGGLASLRELGLRSNELTGLIPSALGKLVGLEKLWLSWNQLKGELPRSLVEMDKLDLLSFAGNDGLCAPGTSAFVAWLADIENPNGPLCNESDRAGLIAFFEATGGDGWIRSEGWLGGGAVGEWYGVVADSSGYVRTLDMAGNGLAGRLPATLGQLAHLNTLRIEDNSLTGQLPTGLAELPLRELRYSDTDLCVPPDASFQAWLATLPVHDGTGRICGTLSDRDILVALYEGTGGPRWKVSDNWLTDAPLDQWHGVAVDGEGRVVRLHFLDNNLTGAIPPELGDMDELQVLDFRYNELKGSIPPELGDLANLRVLQLWANDLTGTIPPELAQLSKLEELWVGTNKLTGAIPPELGGLTSLRELDLEANDLTGAIPPEIGNLANLRELELWANRLTGAIPPTIGKLGSLRKLNLSGNRLSGAIPPELGDLRNLAVVNLSINQLSGTLPSALGNLRNLTKLDLSANQLSGPIPPELGRLGSLESLGVRENQLTGSVPPELGGLDQLTHMDLSDNLGLSGPLPPTLTALARIETLFVGNTDLCAPRDNHFRTWLESRLANGYVPFCPPGERDATAYLTQATEPRTFGVPLVGGERALLRVFVTAARATSLGIPPVRATFYLNDSQAHAAEIPAQTTAIPTEFHEGDLTASANARIPGEIIRPGLEMVIEIDPEGTVPAALGIARRIPETGRLEVDVRDMPELDLTLIPFLWSEAPDSSIVTTVEAMAADPEGHELLWATRALMPVGNLSVKAHEPVMSSSNDAIELFHETQAIRIMEGATSHYMGMLPDDEREGVIGIAFRPGRTSFSLARATTMAHELGHNMSLAHAGCNVFGPVSYPHYGGRIGVWGYDFRGGGRLVSPSTADVMSYCRSPWISDYHFARALHFRLADEGAPGAASAENVRPVRSLLLWGGASADSVPFIEPAFVVDAPEALPAPGGAYELRGRTDDGGVLFSLSFDMPEIADGEGRAAFAFALPVEPSWARELTSITLSGPGGAVTLDGGTGRPVTILRNPGSGQVRAFLRHAPSAALREGGADVGALVLERGLEALFSRGIPNAREWRR